jgi:hypothetical protein
VGVILSGKARIASAKREAPPSADAEAYFSKIRELEASGAHLNPVQSEIVATVELLSGDELARSGHPDRALALWRVAEDRLKVWELGNNYSTLTLLARAEIRQHKLAKARMLAERVQASRYRHPAYASLMQELTDGSR